MEFDYPRTHLSYVKPLISRSLDGWRLVEPECETVNPPFLAIYTTIPKNEPDAPAAIRIPDPGPMDIPRAQVSSKTETRIRAWLKDVEPTHYGPWVSFLPTCRESDPSLDSPDSSVPVPALKPEPTSFIPLFEDESSSADDELEVDTWPYDGRGLYEHHGTHECGMACVVACRRRRKVRLGLGKTLVRMLPWTRDSPIMLNSDVPHPPWSLSYRSNDDTLDSDEEDGDVELWLEHATQNQVLDHELRFRLSLGQKPDSRIFSSWSEWSF